MDFLPNEDFQFTLRKKGVDHSSNSSLLCCLMSRTGKKKAALELLRSLSPEKQKKIIEAMKKKDPLGSEFLERNLITMKDLTCLTPMMLREVLREVHLDELGLALRIVDQEVQNFFMKHLSRAEWEDVEFILKGAKRKISEVEKAQDRILQVVWKKVESGRIVINDKKGGEDYI